MIASVNGGSRVSIHHRDSLHACWKSGSSRCFRAASRDQKPMMAWLPVVVVVVVGVHQNRLHLFLPGARQVAMPGDFPGLPNSHCHVAHLI